jgi:hypothetical protein
MVFYHQRNFDDLELQAKVLKDWMDLSGAPSRCIFGSLASGKNHYLNTHTDEDFFYSLTTVPSTYGL